MPLSEETCLDNQQSIIDHCHIDILTMNSTALSIAKFNGLNYTQWSGEMVLILEQTQVYSIVRGEDGQPEELAEDATSMQKLGPRAEVKDGVQ